MLKTISFAPWVVIRLTALVGILVFWLSYFFPFVFITSTFVMLKIFYASIPLFLAYEIYSTTTSWVMSVTFHANDLIEFQTLIGRKIMPVTDLHHFAISKYDNENPGFRQTTLLCAVGKYRFDGHRCNKALWKLLAEVQRRNPRIQVDDYFLA